jgi:hypothetical protein
LRKAEQEANFQKLKTEGYALATNKDYELLCKQYAKELKILEKHFL